MAMGMKAWLEHLRYGAVLPPIRCTVMPPCNAPGCWYCNVHKWGPEWWLRGAKTKGRGK